MTVVADSGRDAALAEFAANVRWANLPAEVQAKALDHIVDTIGNMIAGAGADDCRAARSAATHWGAGDDATIVCEAARFPASTAAFLNALHGRINAFDDTYEPGAMHPGCSVVCAALALGELHDVDGATLLSAVVAGYEIATRAAAAVSPHHYRAGFHGSGTCTAFGAAAAAARILDFDAGAMAETLGLAGATAAGLRQHQLDGSMFDSAFHGARAAQSGVMVAQLRAAGIKGPRRILDGPFGFCNVMAASADTTRLDAGLAQRYEFLHTTIKPYPTGFFMHGPIEAALTLRQRYALVGAQVAAVEIATFAQSMDVCDRSVVRTPYEGIVSHQYAVAVALVKGKVGLAAFTREAMPDPEVQALLARIHVVHDPALEQYPAKCPHRITIKLHDGRVLEHFSESPPGWRSSLPIDLVDRKFLGQWRVDAPARRALLALRALPRCSSVRTLVRSLGEA